MKRPPLSYPPNRRGSVPRSWIVLALLVVLAAAAVVLSTVREKPGFTLGGAVFPVAPDSIEGLLLTQAGRQYRFDRVGAQGWRLSGASEDYLDPEAMAALVRFLSIAQGGAVLPGTEREDRRYDFNGPDGLRLRVFVAGGQDISLALGARNPVTGNIYASGAGRPGCFSVTGAFRDRISLLPVMVQTKRLLPEFVRGRVQKIAIDDHRLERRAGQWWLLLDGNDREAALRGLPPVVRDYQRWYDDRQVRDESGYWVLADPQLVGQLIYQVSELKVRQILDPITGASRRAQWHLDPPWHQVVLRGEGLNGDPSAPHTDQFSLAFGEPLGQDQVPVSRRGNVMVTSRESILLLEQGPGVLVQQLALQKIARSADRLVVEREGQRLLAAQRTGESVTDEGREAWLTSYPGPGLAGFPDRERHGLSRDFVINLNRIEILKVLPPAQDKRVLGQNERVRVRLYWDGGSQPRELLIEIGFLQESFLPAGAGALARTSGQRPPVGLWLPRSGKLLQIPDQFLVTARNMVAVVAKAVAP